MIGNVPVVRLSRMMMLMMDDERFQSPPGCLNLRLRCSSRNWDKLLSGMDEFHS